MVEIPVIEAVVLVGLGFIMGAVIAAWCNWGKWFNEED